MRKRILYTLFLTSFLAVGQTPCENNMAGGYPCNDYDLMSIIPVSTLANELGNPEGSDVWGWTDPTTQREYVIAAMTNSTAFVDITDPINPIYLGRMDTQNGNTSFWRDVKVYNNHAFVVADIVGNHGMQIFDLTRLRGVTSPQTFSADAVYNGVSSCHNIVINETQSVAYLVDCKNTGRGVHFVDISNPLVPISLGNYNSDGVTHDAQVVTYDGPDHDYKGRELFIGSNENKVVILDVTNKNSVVKISEVTYPQINYTHQGWFGAGQKYFFVGDELDEQNVGVNSRTIILDFTDLDNPTYHAQHEGQTAAIDHNGYVNNGWFYLANYTAGLRVFDISNIANSDNPMTEIGSFDTHPGNDGTSFNGAWSVYPFFSSRNIAVNDINIGLFILRKSERTASVDGFDTLNSKLFPNPVNKGAMLNIEINQNITSIEVYNVLGAVVKSFKGIDKSTFELPTNGLTSGIYLAKINGVVTKKFIVR